MKRGIYWALAWSGIRKNQRLYLPYILTCMGTVMMCYIISFLSISPTFAGIPGGNTMQGFLGMGFGVMSVFSLIFLFYTNSFLIRRRKKEFGLYNILGLGKRNLAVVLAAETVILAALALGGGLLLGILLSKLAELCMIWILGGTAAFSMTVEWGSVCQTALLFGGIFGLIFLNTLCQIHLSHPIQLLRSESVGEKPPKANWVAAVLGVLLLGAAYALAVTIEDPVTAITLFFFAVIMVVIATYLLFIAGSVALCRALQKNPRYYYKTHHFVSVASMAYRMKRNGAGLASICILCTMVLGMVSSTVCLFIGVEDSLRNQYPRNINLDAAVSETSYLDGEAAQETQAMVEAVVAAHGEIQENVLTYRTAAFVGLLEGDRLLLDNALYEQRMDVISDLWQVYIVPLSDYNRLMGTGEALEPGEALLYADAEVDLEGKTIRLGDGGTLEVCRQVEGVQDNGVDAMQVVPSLYFFVPDFAAVVEPLQASQREWVSLHWYYGFDLSCRDEAQIRIQEALAQEAAALEARSPAFAGFHILVDGVATERAGVYGMYGGLFFLGILLGIGFILAAVLILYYKQICEGYEDQAKFDIMQKVGMTQREIRRSINSQVLTVFFLPLAAAGVHLAFAFPLVRKLLLLFGVTNAPLLTAVTAVCFVIFALFYTAVYRMTSGAYFAIVSGMRGENG